MEHYFCESFFRHRVKQSAISRLLLQQIIKSAKSQRICRSARVSCERGKRRTIQQSRVIFRLRSRRRGIKSCIFGSFRCEAVAIRTTNVERMSTSATETATHFQLLRWIVNVKSWLTQSKHQSRLETLFCGRKHNSTRQCRG